MYENYDQAKHKYKVPINRIIADEEIKYIIDSCKSNYDKFIVSILWLTGGRPEEVRMLTKNDFQFDEKKLQIKIKTLKHGCTKEFFPDTRLLEFERREGIDANVYVEFIIKYLGIIQEPQAALIPNGKRSIEKKINELGEKALGIPISPYHFRHSAMMRESKNGATIDMLMHFKGAASTRSVGPYIHARPYISKG
jgi:integrase